MSTATSNTSLRRIHLKLGDSPHLHVGEERYRVEIQAAFQEPALDLLEIVVDCEELRRHYWQRRRVAYWPVVESLLQQLYGEAGRHVREKDPLHPQVNVLLDLQPQNPMLSLEDKKHVEKESGESYRVVVLGGTFDHLHAGHKILLTMSAWLSVEKVVCGVTEDLLLQNKQYRNYLEPIEVRMQNVRAFLTKIDAQLEYEVVPISDIYGPSATDPDMQALVVSQETLAGAEAVNRKRRENGLEALRVHVVGLVANNPGQDTAQQTKLSSTQLRKWLHDKEHKEVIRDSTS